MADLFVSYAREDQDRVGALVALLEGEGWSVFWDRNIPPGETWRSYLGAALEQARGVVVAWSEHSIRSEWVIEEAEEANERGILIPVLLDAVKPPRGFRAIQAADLTGWRQGKNSPAVASFLAAVAKVLRKEPGTKEHAAEEASGNTSGEAQTWGASLRPASAAGLHWPSGRRARWLMFGGLGAAALIGASTIVVSLLDGDAAGPPTASTDIAQPIGGKADGSAREQPRAPTVLAPPVVKAPEASSGLHADIGKNKTLDVKGNVLDVKGLKVPQPISPATGGKQGGGPD